MLLLREIQPLRVSHFPILESVCHFDRSAASNLNSIVHRPARCKGVDTKTCRRIVHLQFVDRFSGLVLNVGIDPIAFVASAPCNCQESESDGGHFDYAGSLIQFPWSFR